MKNLIFLYNMKKQKLKFEKFNLSYLALLTYFHTPVAYSPDLRTRVTTALKTKAGSQRYSNPI